MPECPKLVLVCHPTWMKEEMNRNTVLPVEHSYGLDMPSYTTKDVFWMPQAQAVKFIYSTKHHKLPVPSFIAPGPRLLSEVDIVHTQRRVKWLYAEEAASTLVEWPDGFWKLATAKSDTFIAKTRTHDELIEDLHASNIPAHSILEYSEVFKGEKALRKEFRFFIYSEKNELIPAAGSVYLTHDDTGSLTVYDGAEASKEEMTAATEFVEQFLDSYSVDSLPPSFVLDVGLLADGSFAVIEFNPSWCSAWYNCDVDEVVRTILKGFRASAAQKKQWGYDPDVLLKQQYETAQHLWALKN